MEGNNLPNLPQQEQEKMYQHKSWGDKIEIIAKWIVDIISFLPSLLAAILSQFFKPGTSGARIIGALGFGCGVLLSADGVWQVFFQGTPIFPWYEKGWIGWIGWLALPFNLLFWLSIGISALVAMMESRTLRGKSPEQARQDFEAAKVYKLPEKPKDTIDYARAMWSQYRASGMKELHTNGGIAAGFWIFDIVTTFVSRNPLNYTDPGQILGCLAYNFVTLLAAEIGYKTWEDAKKPR